MTEFERELLDVIRNFQSVAKIEDVNSVYRRIIDLERVAHERMDKLQAKIRELERRIVELEK
jgi:hypothetical protein